jgi:hypothetical protein
MRFLGPAVLLVFMLSPLTTWAAEQPEAGDSYLPPASLRAAPQAATGQRMQQGEGEFRRRSAQTTHRRHEGRRYRAARYGGPRMFFGLF